LDVTRQLRDLKGEGATLHHLAGSYTALDQHEDAIEQLLLALNIFRITGNREAEINTINSLTNAFTLLGQHQKAMEYCQLAMENAIADNDRMTEVETEWQIGLLYEKLDDLDEAIYHMQTLVNFYREICHEDAKARNEYLDKVKEKARWK
jgi:tetratricopeptide (TPR) repeat protein